MVGNEQQRRRSTPDAARGWPVTSGGLSSPRPLRGRRWLSSNVTSSGSSQSCATPMSA